MELEKLFLLLLVNLIAGQVIIREVEPIPPRETVLLNPREVSSYPSIGADIIWKIREPIDLTIKSFNIDYQIGDFLLLSKFPFPSLNGDISPDKLIGLLPLGQGILLSGKVQGEKTYRLIPETYGFLYFHGEYGNRHPAAAGFSIELSPFDKTGSTAPTSTESSITTPIPTRDNFVQKFIRGKEPYIFIKELDKFKSAIAKITNSYCQLKNITLWSDAMASDVKIPYEEIRFCDRGWSEYLTCVEVNFAISVYDTSSNYVMTMERINELWDLFCPELAKSYGFFCYEPPTNPESPMVWIWVAISLSVILIFSLILCVAWIKKTSDELDSDSEIAKAINDTVEDEENFYDRKNPIKDVLRTITQSKSEKDAFVNELLQHQRNSDVNHLEQDEEGTANLQSEYTYHNQLFESDGFTSSSSESDDEDIAEYEHNDFSKAATFEPETSEFRLRRHSPNQNTNETDTLY